MNCTTPEVVCDFASHTGEGCLWHPDEERLYWLDIPPGILYRLDPRSGHIDTFDLGVAVGGFTIQADGRLLLFMADGAVKIWSETGLETVMDELPEERGNRFNDVIADPEGRVFCGVMSTAQRAGRLYRLDPDGTISIMLEGTGTSNGMGFTPDLAQMYHCDSRKKTITLFDYDRHTGSLENGRLFLEAAEGEGKPDGMTVDAEGCVWSARWDGSCIIRYTPAAEEIGRVSFPVRKVSCVTFGGGDLADIYATTAGGYQKDVDGEHAGALFRFRCGVKGTPEFRSRIRM